MTDFAGIIHVLVDGGIDFILVGGVAATVHGSARLTRDVDVVYSRDAENNRRLAAVLMPYAPYLRGAPPGLPFSWDQSTIQRGLNFTLTTTLGDLDLLGEITGGGGFGDLLPYAQRVTIFDRDVLCLGLARLIHVKRAAGRPRDLEAIAELELLRDEARNDEQR